MAVKHVSTRNIPTAEIVRDHSFQFRVSGTNEETLTAYTEAMQMGGVFPPIKVIIHDGGYQLLDGFHRVEASLRAGRSSVSAMIFEHDSLIEAKLLAAQSNATNALPLTRADKRHIVWWYLQNNPATRDSNIAIARKLGVSEATIRNIKADREQLRTALKQDGGQTTVDWAKKYNIPAYLIDEERELPDAVATDRIEFERNGKAQEMARPAARPTTAPSFSPTGTANGQNTSATNLDSDERAEVKSDVEIKPISVSYVPTLTPNGANGQTISANSAESRWVKLAEDEIFDLYAITSRKIVVIRVVSADENGFVQAIKQDGTTMLTLSRDGDRFVNTLSGSYYYRSVSVAGAEAVREVENKLEKARQAVKELESERGVLSALAIAVSPLFEETKIACATIENPLSGRRLNGTYRRVHSDK